MAYTDIDKPSDYFETKLYTGNGGTLNVTGLDFAPNWVWIKSRTSTRVHCLFDTVRGATKRLQTNEADTEYTTSNSLTGFNSDGFSLGSYNQSNEGSASFASWNWKAGTSFTNDASSTGIGSIDSAGSVNTDAGFDIVSYTGNATGGRTIAHSLSAVPKMMIVKNRDADIKWAVYHASNTAAPGTDHLKLNANDATADDDSTWNDTVPTSSVFSVGGSTSTNGDGTAYIAYLFADVKGYSNFGIYTGNGSASDGPVAHLGFRPAFLIIKNNSHADDWRLFDDKRSTTGPSNPIDKHIYAHTSGAEAASSTNGVPDGVDFLSNGFKIRQATNGLNRDGGTYIYMAWAASPFVNSNGIPTTAF